MLAERSLLVLPFFAILNSIYLSYINLEDFFLEKNTDEMAENLGIIFGLNIFVIAFVITLNGLRKKYETNEKKWFLIFRFYFKKKIFLIVLMLFLGLIVFAFLKDGTNKSYTSIFLVTIEIISISLLISYKRKEAIENLFGYVIGGMYLLMLPFSLFGFCEQYLGYTEFKNPHLILVFAAIFYHLLSACYMFYQALPKEITRYDFKEDKRKPKKPKKILATSIAVLLLSFSLVSCSFKSDSEFIQNRFWKYGEGFQAKTDILILTNENLRNDTIFVHKKPIAVVIKLEDFKSDLIIKSIKTNYFGRYLDQG